MAKEIGVFDAKTRLSDLLQQVANGEEFIITRRGVPVARLCPCAEAAEADAAKNALKRIADRARLAGNGPFNWAEWKDGDE